MTAKYGFSAIVFIVFTVLACSSIVTQTEKDSSVNRKAYKTYSWLTQNEVQFLNLENPNVGYLSSTMSIHRNPKIEQEVRQTVDPQLKSDGYTPEAVGIPDFFVSFYVELRDFDWVSTWDGRTPSLMNVPLVAFPDYSRTSAYQVRPGSIILVFYDSKTRRPSWSAVKGGLYTETGESLPELKASVVSLVNQFHATA